MLRRRGLPSGLFPPLDAPQPLLSASPRGQLTVRVLGPETPRLLGCLLGILWSHDAAKGALWSGGPALPAGLPRQQPLEFLRMEPRPLCHSHPGLASASVLRGEATGLLLQAGRDQAILTLPPLAGERRPQLLPLGASRAPLPVLQSCWSLGSGCGLAARQGSIQVQGSARTMQVGTGLGLQLVRLGGL